MTRLAPRKQLCSAFLVNVKKVLVFPKITVKQTEKQIQRT